MGTAIHTLILLVIILFVKYVVYCICVLEIDMLQDKSSNDDNLMMKSL